MVKVIWRKRALSQLKKQYKHIKKDSLQSAEKVRDTIFDMAEDLKNHPEIYPLDKYFKENTGDVRAFEKFRLRVAYQITKKEIRIIRVRHTNKNPLEY